MFFHWSCLACLATIPSPIQDAISIFKKWNHLKPYYHCWNENKDTGHQSLRKYTFSVKQKFTLDSVTNNNWCLLK